MIKQNTTKETSKSEKSNWKIEGREKNKKKKIKDSLPTTLAFYSKITSHNKSRHVNCRWHPNLFSLHKIEFTCLGVLVRSIFPPTQPLSHILVFSSNKVITYTKAIFFEDSNSSQRALTILQLVIWQCLQ